MYFTYLLVFAYTKNGNCYFTNKTISLREAFSEDDKEIQEAIASKENAHTSRISFMCEIIKSRKPSND